MRDVRENEKIASAVAASAVLSEERNIPKAAMQSLVNT